MMSYNRGVDEGGWWVCQGCCGGARVRLGETYGYCTARAWYYLSKIFKITALDG